MEQTPTTDATIINNLDALIASVSATIQFSLRTTKQLGGAGKLNSPEGSDFFLGYLAGFADSLVQAAGGAAQGEAARALIERSLLRLFGAEGAQNLFASIDGALSGRFPPSASFRKGLAAGADDAQQVLTDKEGKTVGKSFIEWFAPHAGG